MTLWLPQHRQTIIRRVRRKSEEQLEVNQMKLETCALSVGMQSGMTARENSVEIP